jgi:hypothetical protein
MYQERFCGKTDPRTIFTIDAKCGYKIELFSDFGGAEAEVLFPPLTKLQVTNSMKHCDPQCLVDKDAGLPDQICLKQVMPSTSSTHGPSSPEDEKWALLFTKGLSGADEVSFHGSGKTRAGSPHWPTPWQTYRYKIKAQIYRDKRAVLSFQYTETTGNLETALDSIQLVGVTGNLKIQLKDMVVEGIKEDCPFVDSIHILHIEYNPNTLQLTGRFKVTGKEKSPVCGTVEFESSNSGFEME